MIPEQYYLFQANIPIIGMAHPRLIRFYTKRDGFESEEEAMKWAINMYHSIGRSLSATSSRDTRNHKFELLLVGVIIKRFEHLPIREHSIKACEILELTPFMREKN